MASALMSAACGSSSSGSTDDALVFNVGSAVSTVVMSPYTVVPQVNGYWKDAGVDVEVQNANGSTAALQLLLSGRADIVISGTDTTYSTAAQNKDLRVVSLIPGNVWRIGVPESSSISGVEQLRGKTIGVISLTSGSYTYGRSIVRAAGLNPDSDVSWLPIGTGTQAAEAIDSGRVQAFSAYDGPLDLVSAVTQEKLRALPSALDDIAGSMGYVTTKKVLETRRDDIEAFLKGSYQGMEFSLANPDAAIQIYWEQFPDQKPAGMAQADAVAEAKHSVTNAWANRFGVGDDGMRGYLTDENVEEAANFFTKYQITEGEVPYKEVVDLDLNKTANTFDAEQVKAAATAWKP
ncbi:ABC transporter substrate-binding protein [Rhodococcus sp. NPDC127530]|uniref:ABC transporter substrate-binding protein n=1 Tax=unclassified Rhodococcus (in: high G+C Gram-positive bacteria) TaxID=192944 RepID=UPI00363700EF